ncbi:BatD family protein [Leptospira gomenensis]|uniref:BatD family protein n=1 Tax=Leptospira gomenensis TaxID=2484974 RepID=UPI001FE81DFF|nr:BatD family protein [Leptospira gomenensis]
MKSRLYRLILFLFCSALNAEETKFYVTRNIFPMGEESLAVFELDMNSKFSIPNSSFSNGDITLVYAGVEENTTIVNFQVFRKRLLKFRIRASKEGSFTLPSVAIDVDGKRFTPEPIRIQVLSGSKTAKSKGARSFFDRFFQFEGEELPENADLKVIFQTSKKETWVGEPIIGYFTLYYKDVRKPYFDRNPADSIQFPYFRSEVLSGVAVKVPDQVLYEGKVYDIAVYNKEIYSLVPLRPGEFHLGKTTFSLEGQLQSYFNVKTIETVPNRITVKALPKFSGVFSGAVGNFRTQVKLKNDPDDIALGDTLYFTLIVEGEGNLSAVADPWGASCLSGKGCSVKSTLYDTFRSWKFTELENSGYGFYSIARFEYGLPAEKSGVWKPENREFVFFDPISGSYRASVFEFPSVAVSSVSKRRDDTIPETNRYAGDSYSPLRNPSVIAAVFLTASFLGLLIWGAGRGSLNRKYFRWISGLFPILGLPVLKELDALVGNKRGFVLKQFLLSKGTSEPEASFLAGLSRTTASFTELSKDMNSAERKGLFTVASKVVEKLKEDKL